MDWPQLGMFALIAALLIAGFIVHHYMAHKRREALAALAARRGWRFSDKQDISIPSQYSHFDCIKQGSYRYAFNVLEMNTAERKATGFDYHYQTESTDSKGRRTTNHHYFSALVLETGLPLKSLFIRPENFFDKIGEVLGWDDIDFESDQFSRAFCVKAEDRRWAFDVIHQATMEFLLGAPRFTIQLAAGNIMVYRASCFAVPDFDHALNVAAGIVDRLPKYVRHDLASPG